MKTTFVSLASALVVGRFMMACVGNGDADDVEDSDELLGHPQVSQLSPQDKKVSAPSTSSSACAGSKVKTSCKQQQQVLDFIKQ